MPIQTLDIAMGTMFIAIWLIIAQIIVGDRARRRRERVRTMLQEN